MTIVAWASISVGGLLSWLSSSVALECAETGFCAPNVVVGCSGYHISTPLYPGPPTLVIVLPMSSAPSANIKVLLFPLDLSL